MKVKTRKRVLYEFQTEDGQRHWVEFVRLAQASAPLFTHRVVIDGEAKDWLADTHPPNLRSAAFFLQKHMAQPVGQNVGVKR